MTPAARVQAAIEVVDAWMSGAEGLDRVLAGWGRAHRFAGSKDRRAITDLVYDAVRRRRSAAWAAGGSEAVARDLLRGSLMLDGIDPAALFEGGRFGPETLTPGEREPPQPLAEAPRMVQLDLPDWIASHLESFPDTALTPLRSRAPVDLRVNTLRGNPEEAIAALAADGVVVELGPLSPTALRVTSGATRVAGTRAYQEGMVEIQDAGSQATVAFAEPAPGERILDMCAGGGGKSLALGALTGGDGQIDAYDVSRKRMSDLPKRANRAGLNVRCLDRAALEAATGQYDMVFVDAPCSGSGAWRRNPDAKWRFDQSRLEALRGMQAEVLAQGARLCAPAGRLVYVTCSLVTAENSAQVSEFLSTHSAWLERRRRSFTLLDGGDGFFVSVLARD